MNRRKTRLSYYEWASLRQGKKLRDVLVNIARSLHRIALALEKPSTPKVPHSVRWRVGIPTNEGE